MSTRHVFAFLTSCVLASAACGGGEAPKPAEAPASTAPAAVAAAAPAAAAGGGGSITGKVSFEGTVPAAEKVKLSADPKCAAMHKDGLERSAIHVKDGGLGEALVSGLVTPDTFVLRGPELASPPQFSPSSPRNPK
jgi:hypothetical protein